MSHLVISLRHSGEKLRRVWTAFYLSFISASECEWFTPQSTWRLRDTSLCLSVSLNQDNVIKLPWKGTEIGLVGLNYARMCHHSWMLDLYVACSSRTWHQWTSIQSLISIINHRQYQCANIGSFVHSLELPTSRCFLHTSLGFNYHTPKCLSTYVFL